ncbi:unnamed protein product [Amoebophrya sp. A25]|nr:unnamed protein product [Amoebophrya sp. A25]|eukprot:GSA25T00021762001.1
MSIRAKLLGPRGQLRPKYDPLFGQLLVSERTHQLVW